MDAPLVAFAPPPVVTSPDVASPASVPLHLPWGGTIAGSSFATLILGLLPSEGESEGSVPVSAPADANPEGTAQKEGDGTGPVAAVSVLLSPVPALAISSSEVPQGAPPSSGLTGNSAEPAARRLFAAALPSGAVSELAGRGTLAEGPSPATGPGSGLPDGSGGALGDEVPEAGGNIRAESPPLRPSSDGERAELPLSDRGETPPPAERPEGASGALLLSKAEGETSFLPTTDAPAPEPPPPGPPAGDSRAVRTVGSARMSEPHSHAPVGGEGRPEHGTRPGRGPEVRDLVQALPPTERGARGLPRAAEEARAHADEHSAVQRSVAAPGSTPPAGAHSSAPAASDETGATLPEAATLPEPLRPVVDAVVELDRQGSEARIQLDPPELGDVVIRIQRGADGLHIDVRVDRPETLQLFVAHRAAFEAQLGQRGLALAGLAIDLAGNGTGRRSGQGHEPPIRADGSFGALLGIESRPVSPLQRRARLAYNPDGRLVAWA
ncbi:hypothetical protein HRbin29_01105 [bacterium HR29]|jgi:hypothetical protein|nr:hypothetical protein HRbin29_01105 [bacterium HR29]